MTSNFFCADNMRDFQFQELTAFIDTVKSAIICNNQDVNLAVKRKFKALCYRIFTDKSLNNKSKVLEHILFNSLYEILIENKAKVSQILNLYDSCGFIDYLTFFIYQVQLSPLSDEKINKEKIREYLDLMQDESFFKSSVFYFSRINREFVKSLYSFSIKDLTPKELYFSISTGYYFLKESRKELSKRLQTLIIEYTNKRSYTSHYIYDWSINNPLFVLKRLYDDGFIPSLEKPCNCCNIDSALIEGKPTIYWG